VVVRISPFIRWPNLVCHYNPRHQHTVTLYAKGLTCKADTLGSGGYVYLAVYPTPETKK
ncbi:type IV toxin-antitoxin system YeeU family antitoxin, partial [Escherichia coli]|nr:type IV toxin-antitoxin system YeeU family antitoxin [Escherichia coli]